MADNIFDFIGGDSGQWKVRRMEAFKGNPLPSVSFIDVVPGTVTKSEKGIWNLKGLTSNLRYTEKQEKDELVAIQAGLGRTESAFGAMIPMRKSEAWWNLAQDERRKIFEDKSRHTQTGLKYLPAIARRLYHCRDIGEQFDFVTWFEYAPHDSEAFEELVNALRQTEEWKYVDREMDIRMIKE